MGTKRSASEKAIDCAIYAVVIVLALLCILPVAHMLALSFSSRAASSAGVVALWPVGFTTAVYEYVFARREFIRAMGVSLLRLALAVPLSVFMVLITAYPLSKSPRVFKGRTVFMWYFIFAMLFSPGLVPVYLLVGQLRLMDSIWALVLTLCMPVYNTILVVNYFRGLPQSIEESAFIDGASHWTVLWKIFVPLSLPSLATVGLLTAVTHWNNWFDGLIYMNDPANYPVQTYVRILLTQLSTLLRRTSQESWHKIMELSSRNLEAALIIVGMLPILCVYPFLQKYFTTGLVLGGVKE